MRIVTVLAATMLASAAQAAVVINPIAPVQPGLTLGITKFTTVPGTTRSRARTGAQGLQGIGDRSGRLFVHDTRGIVYVTDGSGRTPTPYLDLRTQGIGFSNAANSTQTGLMALTFHPNFGKDRTKPGYNLFYTVDTTATTGGTPDWTPPTGPVSHHDVVREWTVADPKAATASIRSSRELTRLAQPRSDHGPGRIGFNPAAPEGSADYGKLYIGLGDGGGTNDPDNNAQNLGSPFGKIMRIDPVDPDGAGPLKYGIPSDNPFVGEADARGEIWAYGLRNPQHFSWDSTGRMLISELGQSRIEEVNEGLPGANYGWPLREGTFARSLDKGNSNIFDTPPGSALFTDPIAQYDHEEIERDGISGLVGIGGAYRYEGRLIPELIGKVVMTDLVSGRIFYFDPETGSTGTPAILTELKLTLDGLVTTLRKLEGYGSATRVDLRLGVDSKGELFLVTKADGDIYRFVSTIVPEPATWLTMIAGFGMVGAALRRRRGRFITA
jgi:hypothetical protein